MYKGGGEGAGNSLHKTEISTAPAISVAELWNSVIKQASRHGLLKLSISCPAWLTRTVAIGIFRANGYVEYERICEIIITIIILLTW
jgi:hypothetical protein